MLPERSLKELADRLDERLREIHPDEIGDGFRARIQELLMGVRQLIYRAEGTRKEPVKITDKEEF